MATNEFNVANTSLQKIQPDILGFGIADFADQLTMDAISCLFDLMEIRLSYFD